MSIPFPRQDRIHNGQSTYTCDIAQYSMYLHIHLIQSLLHVLNVLAGRLHHPTAVP